MSEQTKPVWWWIPPREGELVPDMAPIDISDRVAAHHVEGRCDRWCLDTPIGPCADMCVMDWIRSTD